MCTSKFPSLAFLVLALVGLCVELVLGQVDVVAGALVLALNLGLEVAIAGVLAPLGVDLVLGLVEFVASALEVAASGLGLGLVEATEVVASALALVLGLGLEVTACLGLEVAAGIAGALAPVAGPVAGVDLVLGLV